MDIKTIQDVAKLADMCRKKGIKQLRINADGVEIVLNDKPKMRLAKPLNDKIDSNIGPTEEEMLFWSSAQLTGAQ